MNVRIASLAVAIAFMSFPAYAQRYGSAGETIHSLSAKLAALTARVAKLESGQITESDIVGTYGWAYMGIELLGSPGRISNETITATLTFTSNGNIEFNGTSDDCELTQGVPWTVSCAPQESGNAVVVGTWRFQNGTLYVTFEGDDTEDAMFVGAGGRTIVFSGMVTEEYAPGLRLAFSNIGVLVKLPSQ